MTKQEARQALQSGGNFQGLQDHLQTLADGNTTDTPLPVSVIQLAKDYKVHRATVRKAVSQHPGKLRTMTNSEVQQGRRRDAQGTVTAIPSFQISSGHLSAENVLQFQWHIKIGDKPYSEDELRKHLEKNASGLSNALLRRALAVIESAKQTENKPLSSLEEAQLRAGQVPVRILGMLPKRGVNFEFPAQAQAVSRQAQEYLDILTRHAQIPTLPIPTGWTENKAFQLKPFQLEGLSWLNHLTHLGLGACLADDMGLGKTPQALALILQRKNTTPPSKRKPALIVVPMSLLNGWTKARHDFTPTLNMATYYGSKKNPHFADADIVLTTYDRLFQDFSNGKTLCNRDWSGVFLDEAQRIKNKKTSISGVVNTLISHSQYRVLLTGTPMENHVGELYGLMDFLNPGWLGTPEFFNKRYFNPIHKARGHMAEHGFEEAQVSEKARQDLKQRIEPFILRRSKTDPVIQSQLDAKSSYQVHYHPQAIVLNDAEQQSYQTHRDAVAAQLKDPNPDAKAKRTLLLKTILQLKQRCIHPYLINKDAALKTQFVMPNEGKAGDMVYIERLSDTTYHDFLQKQENKILLEQALGALKHDLRTVVEMTYFEDMSQMQIAKHLGISQMQVSRRLRKALEQMHTSLHYA